MCDTETLNGLLNLAELASIERMQLVQQPQVDVVVRAVERDHCPLSSFTNFKTWSGVQMPIPTIRPRRPQLPACGMNNAFRAGTGHRCSRHHMRAVVARQLGPVLLHAPHAGNDGVLVEAVDVEGCGIPMLSARMSSSIVYINEPS